MDSTDRVMTFIKENGLNADIKILAPDSTRTSASAAQTLGCSVAEIAKTIGFISSDSKCILIVLSGEKRVSLKKVSLELDLDPSQIRKMSAQETKEMTGYSIGGVPPFPHIDGLISLVDRSLFQFGNVWAAAGSPNSVMKIDPKILIEKLKMRQVDVSE